MKNVNQNNRLTYHLSTLLLAVFMSWSLLGVADSAANENPELAADLSTFFRAARKVISKNQKHINDANIGDKGLSGESVLAKAKENYKSASGKDFPNSFDETIDGQSKKSMVEAVTEVMNQAQALINEKGKGFKGFLPAVFAGRVAADFSTRMSGKASIKLTAPKSYIRNLKNRPDKWETNVIETMFKSDGWEKGSAFSETSSHKGRPGLRYILPEYYGQSCLNCHGTPKGERDITGGKKEGGVLGELGGAISVVLYE